MKTLAVRKNFLRNFPASPASRKMAAYVLDRDWSLVLRFRSDVFLCAANFTRELVDLPLAAQVSPRNREVSLSCRVRYTTIIPFNDVDSRTYLAPRFTFFADTWRARNNVIIVLCGLERGNVYTYMYVRTAGPRRVEQFK